MRVEKRPINARSMDRVVINTGFFHLDLGPGAWAVTPQTPAEAVLVCCILRFLAERSEISGSSSGLS